MFERVEKRAVMLIVVVRVRLVLWCAEDDGGRGCRFLLRCGGGSQGGAGEAAAAARRAAAVCLNTDGPLLRGRMQGSTVSDDRFKRLTGSLTGGGAKVNGGESHGAPAGAGCRMWS